MTPPLPKDPLLANALEAIENGMEDFADGRPSRVSSALRNLCAGVLLLLKEKLRQLSPPGTNGSLIYRKLVPSNLNGAVVMVGKGTSTVDLEDIQERLKPFGFHVDWNRVYALRKLRNAVEHHHAGAPHAVTQQAIANTFTVLVRIFDQLGLVPAVELSSSALERMLQEAETFSELAKACRSSRSAILGLPMYAAPTLEEWTCCPTCSSELMKASGPSYAETTFTCQACGESFELAGAVEAALENEYTGSAYEAAKQGCREPVGVCPTCTADAFVLESDVCYVCGEGRPYKRCHRCGSGLSIDEQDSNGLCGYCSHVMSKDD